MSVPNSIKTLNYCTIHCCNMYWGNVLKKNQCFFCLFFWFLGQTRHHCHNQITSSRKKHMDNQYMLMYSAKWKPLSCTTWLLELSHWPPVRVSSVPLEAIVEYTKQALASCLPLQACSLLKREKKIHDIEISNNYCFFYQNNQVQDKFCKFLKKNSEYNWWSVNTNLWKRLSTLFLWISSC